MEKNIPLLISVGTIEYHGSQLPIGTDLLIVEGILREIEKKADVAVAPPFIYSPTGYMVSGPEKGTIDISIDCFINHCTEILTAYKRMGFQKIYIFVHHQGGNIAAFMKTAILKMNAYNLKDEFGDGWWTDNKSPENEYSIEIVPAVFEKDAEKAFAGHGGKGETQAVMGLYPELVHLENLTDNEARWNDSIKSNSEEANIEMQKLISIWTEKFTIREE